MVAGPALELELARVVERALTGGQSPGVDECEPTVDRDPQPVSTDRELGPRPAPTEAPALDPPSRDPDQVFALAVGAQQPGLAASIEDRRLRADVEQRLPALGGAPPLAASPE